MDFKKTIKAHEEAVVRLKQECIPVIEQMAEMCRQAL